MGEREHGPLEYRIQCADGRYLWLRGEGISHLDEEGRTKRFLTSYIDITDLRKMNAALQESVRLREEVERIARHDLKTPLNSIVAAARLLREERTPTESEAELLDVVERAGYRVLSMVNLSFDIFRMERGEYRFQPQAVDLSQLVERIAADLRIHAVSKGVGLRLPQGGTPVHAWADELLCYSILANLLKNAIEASPDSAAVTVTLSEAGANVLLSVHNHGEVPEPVRAHFFEKYSTSGKSGGLGLGTYSARLLARVQEGDISMRTSVREGTTLEIRLLALPYGLQPVPEADERGDSPAAPAIVLPPLKVLVADDDEYNLLVMRRYLPSPPLTVRTEANGRAALDALEGFPADVIFMDLEMPVMDGYEAVARIRERERATGAKPAGIVAFSSHDDEESKRRALDLGCNLYLRKPAAREAVHRVLLELSGHAAPAGGPGAAPVSEPPIGPADAALVDADMRETVPEFLRSRLEALGQMGEALRAGDQAGVRRIAHKLSGSFALYGFRWASEQCRAIETGKAGAPGLPAQIEALGHHLGSVEIRYSDDEPVTDRQKKGSRE
jgi:CheY-like chemotaxis protein